ncbi:COMM domain-containing protein 6 isoform X2 [Cavia porcellus]|uniref:COMM domain-containing protein 6 isoform X2 n=1 Tax=Cavia porcellus TaxID=10141 RepID=UPI002FE1EF48
MEGSGSREPVLDAKSEVTSQVSQRPPRPVPTSPPVDSGGRQHPARPSQLEMPLISTDSSRKLLLLLKLCENWLLGLINAIILK